MSIAVNNPTIVSALNVGPYGLAAMVLGANNFAGSRTDVTTAGTNTALSVADFRGGWIFLNPGASGAYTITLPATADILALMLPLSTDLVGGAVSFTKVMMLSNNVSGFTGTITAGDGSTTLSGEMTVPSLFTRLVLLNITSSSTIEMQNIGIMNLSFGSPTTITAHVGGGQGGATVINPNVFLTRVGGVATDGDSVLLPSSIGGGGPPYVVANLGTHSMDVFPQSGQQINLLAANTALAVASGTTVAFYDINPGVWASI